MAKDGLKKMPEKNHRFGCWLRLPIGAHCSALIALTPQILRAKKMSLILRNGCESYMKDERWVHCNSVFQVVNH